MDRERIESERAQVTARIASLQAQHEAIVEGSRFTTDDDEHDPEGSTIAFERAGIASMIKDSQNELRELDAAEARLAAGTYGVCERCGGPIAEARLDALPAARRCIGCSGKRARSAF